MNIQFLHVSFSALPQSDLFTSMDINIGRLQKKVKVLIIETLAIIKTYLTQISKLSLQKKKRHSINNKCIAFNNLVEFFDSMK